MDFKDSCHSFIKSTLGVLITCNPYDFFDNYQATGQENITLDNQIAEKSVEPHLLSHLNMQEPKACDIQFPNEITNGD